MKCQRGLDFPLCGLEMIAKTGLGWSAFSNMYLDHDLSDSASVPALVAGSWSPSSCSSSAATRIKKHHTLCSLHN